MHFINFSIFAVIICPSIISIHASEYCGLMTYCKHYCCKSNYYSNYCCSDCRNSINYQPYCNYSRNSIPFIIGGVISSIIFIIVVSLIISICCGCICSSRTGIQRRGRILRTQQPTVTVMNSNMIAENEFVSPPYAVVYPPGQAPYPHGQLPYPPAYPDIKSNQQGPIPPYPANLNHENPPPYNMGFVPDHH